jgi:cobalt/nickel transport protein
VSAPNRSQQNNGRGYRFLDGFTRTMLATMFTILLGIYFSGNYMSAHGMAGVGTDDKVNNLAATTSHGSHHPFVQLPGDAELGAFSVANFFAGLIVGYHWARLFGSKAPVRPEDNKD